MMVRRSIWIQTEDSHHLRRQSRNHLPYQERTHAFHESAQNGGQLFLHRRRRRSRLQQFGQKLLARADKRGVGLEGASGSGARSRVDGSLDDILHQTGGFLLGAIADRFLWTTTRGAAAGGCSRRGCRCRRGITAGKGLSCYCGCCDSYGRSSYVVVESSHRDKCMGPSTRGKRQNK